MKIFFDTEFTHLGSNADLISIGCVTEAGDRFYAERIEYDESKLSDYTKQNVLSNLLFKDEPSVNTVIASPSFDNKSYKVKGKLDFIRDHLEIWLKTFPNVEMWGDCIVYDWIMFTEQIFQGKIPPHVFYVPFDILPLFEVVGIDPDITRVDYAEMSPDSTIYQHNSLYDSDVIKACHDKLMLHLTKK